MNFSDVEVPSSACQVMYSVCSAIVLGLIGHTAIVTYERYIFFCHPYHYLHRFKISRLAAVLVMCYTIPVILATSWVRRSDRTFHASILSCSSDAYNGSMLVLILLPSATVTLYCTIRVWQLCSNAAVAPAVAGDQGNQSTPVPQAKKALKMMLLISGTFWGTTLPASVVRLTIFMAGYTWDDLDSRRYMGPAIMMRLTTFIYCFISSAVNPLIYYYSRKDLRLATCKMLQWNRNIAHPEIIEMN